MKKYPTDLTVDWALLGERGWWIDESGAEAADLDPTETMGCHLDRATLHLILCGSPEWCRDRLWDLGDAGVPAFDPFRRWRVILPNDNRTYLRVITP